MKCTFWICFLFPDLSDSTSMFFLQMPVSWASVWLFTLKPTLFFLHWQLLGASGTASQQHESLLRRIGGTSFFSPGFIFMWQIFPVLSIFSATFVQREQYCGVSYFAATSSSTCMCNFLYIPCFALQDSCSVCFRFLNDVLLFHVMFYCT